MYRISCFADEIAGDLHKQIEVMQECGIRYMELRSVWDTNVLALSGGQLAEVKHGLNDHGISVSCIGSAVGKTGIERPFAETEESLKKAVDTAHELDVRYIRVFSFYGEGKGFADHRDIIVERFAAMAQTAKENDIILLNENEKDVFLNTSGKCLAVMQAVNSPHFRCAFDGSNFRSVGEKPFDQSLPPLFPYVDYVHVKDSRNSDGSKVPAGEGDAQVSEWLNALKGKEGLFLSLEPHLEVTGKLRGFSGPEKFKLAHQALIRILKLLQIDYS